jgi:predicted metal-dependent hydrolase
MTTQKKKPIIVGFVADLMFSTQIENVARRLGYQIEWIENPSELAPADPDAPKETPGELLHGQGGALFSKLSAWQPVLLLFDLDNDEIPWRNWIANLKSSPATRRIPILCFGSHVDTESLKDANRMGANTVVARSRFSKALPELIQSNARRSKHEDINDACDQPLAELAAQGIEMYNEGHYYQCHDYLEEAWMADETPGRNLYRGILQVGIAYYQIERGNYRGALKMLLRVKQWLAPLPSTCRQVNVSRLREDVDNVQQALQTLGPDAMDKFDRSLFRKIETF